MPFKAYDRQKAVAYARRWAFRRNPVFYDFSALGGDCTSFVSQCVYAGACQMNYTPTFGWYFRSIGDRSPSWSGVQFFYEFMVSNNGAGPRAQEVGKSELEIGDVIQLGNETGEFYHTLLVTSVRNGGYLVAAHTNDAFDRPLSSYSYARARYLHLREVAYEGNEPVCPEYMEVFHAEPSHSTYL